MEPTTGAPLERSVADALAWFVPLLVQSRRQQLLELVDALRSPGLLRAQQWAHIDLIGAFDPDSSIHGRTSSSTVWRSIATFGMFVPLLLTWVGLHEAIVAFERMPLVERADTFFEQWIRGFGEHSGPLGSLNSLSAISILTAGVFALLILAGWLGDSSSRRAAEQRAAFRGALTDAMRMLDVWFPETPVDVLAATRVLTEQMRSAGAAAVDAQSAIRAGQAEILRRTSDVVDRMHSELAAAQAELLESLQAGLAQCTEAMVTSGELVATMANHSRDELSRSADRDRILVHVADSAELLREAAERIAAERIAAEPLVGSRVADGPMGGR
ncbi:MAG: hypothetical protein WCF04_11865 [Candidatus Nanopelagicales bacterium]